MSRKPSEKSSTPAQLDIRQSEVIQVSSEQLAMVREAEAAYELGEGYTIDEVIEHARAKVEAWLPSQSA